MNSEDREKIRQLSDPSLSAGLLLLVGQLLRRLGELEVTMNPDDIEGIGQLMVDDNGEQLTVRRLIEGKE